MELQLIKKEITGIGKLKGSWIEVHFSWNFKILKYCLNLNIHLGY